MAAARRVLVVASIVMACAPATARADDDGPQSAEALFDRGRALMKNEATLGEGCRALERSLALVERGDTLLNLAECHRLEGRTASAWAEFDRAAALAEKMGFAEAVVVAARLRDHLAPKLSTLTVTLAPETAALEGIAVRVNGASLPHERWNTPVPLDPGAIAVEAEAKDRKPFHVVVNLGADHVRKTIDVVLEPVPPSPAPAPLPPPPPPSHGKPVATGWAWAVGAAGATLVADAFYFNAISQRAHDDRAHDTETRTFVLARACAVAGVAGMLVGVGGVGFGLSRRAAHGTSAIVLRPASIAFEASF